MAGRIFRALANETGLLMVSQLSSPTNYSSGFVTQSVARSSRHPRARGHHFQMVRTIQLTLVLEVKCV